MPMVRPIAAAAVLLLVVSCAAPRGDVVSSAAPDEPRGDVVSYAAPDEPRGSYVEARTATVFAGACHYGSEFAMQGREAVLAWHLESGSRGGVPLAGVDLVAVVAADENLDTEVAPRTSVVFVSDAASAAQHEAAVAWLREAHGKAVGRIVEVHAAPVSVDRDGERFSVTAADALELRGSTLADRACCSQPHNVWYDPLAIVQSPVVGNAAVFRCEAEPLRRSWSLPGDNCAFVATF